MKSIKTFTIVLGLLIFSLVAYDLYGYGYGRPYRYKQSDISFTIKGGVILSDMLVERLNSHSGVFSFNGGVGIEKTVVPSWLRFVPELFYYQNGCHITYSDSENVYLYTEVRTYKYITLPLSLKLVVGGENAIFLQTGIEPALLINAVQSWIHRDKSDENITSALNGFELRGLLSFGLQFNWLILELRINLSITPAEDNLDWGEMRNYSVGALFGIKFDM